MGLLSGHRHCLRSGTVQVKKDHKGLMRLTKCPPGRYYIKQWTLAHSVLHSARHVVGLTTHCMHLYMLDNTGDTRQPHAYASLVVCIVWLDTRLAPSLRPLDMPRM